MATVSEVCEAIAQSANMPVNEVKKYARALINSGDLPKAIGRSVPHTDMHHRAKLILAIAATDRPTDCVIAMRERYEAPSADGLKLNAGEVLADELREFSDAPKKAFQKWSYSVLEVSRTVVRVQFRINENMRRFDGFNNVRQPEFIAWPKDIEELEATKSRLKNSGLSVSALVPGDVLIAAAYGSPEAYRAARVEMIGASSDEMRKG